MEMAENKCGGDFVAGVLVGALVGAAAALLLAPQSGEETRILIRDKSLELKEQADDLSVEARKRAEQIQAQARDKAVELQSQAKDRAAGIQTQVKQAVEEGKSAASKRKEDLLSRLEGQEPDDETPAVD
jgi:gas vesicle protein